MKGLFFQITLFLVTSVFFIPVSANFAESAEVDEHIVLWLRYDEGEGDVAVDTSNYGNDGVINGAEWVEGKYGSALSFNGTSDYVEVEDDESLLLTKDGLTIAVWCKTTQHDVQCAITIEKGPDWGPGSYCINYPGYDLGKVRFQIHPKWIDSETGDDELSDDEWHYFAGTYSDGTYRVYVDGELETEEKSQATITPMLGSTYIGCRNGSTFFYEGVMDELLVANVAFTEDQMNRHMAGTLLPVQPAGKLATVWGKIKKIGE